ncbi:ribose-5-phosphate isomerase RpiA [Taylorella equigenitalis]|uniref:ribose-5-phosphate isomerase RpiA n=1 Tax=Taylorella equigenitalis TaxID=29575 RepID=UPI00041558D6|nr:ribose-5-phosphate isomerase RpiA [Taylorella equigenitalis]WDU48607.1 ribose-5-phosphate isomerase RpiA [Taylorella equigenitalis]
MVKTQDELKKEVANEAIKYVLEMVGPNDTIGVGTGSTANFFIELLSNHKDKFRDTVASSVKSEELLTKFGIPVVDLNMRETIKVYVDGADEINPNLHLIKGGGGALLREKVVASASDYFICIADESKLVEKLGAFKLPIEVIPMAVSVVSRKIKELGGDAFLREGFLTDNGNQIIDVAGFSVSDARELETQINQIPGVVCCGFFALRPPELALVSSQNGVRTIKLK